MTTYSLTTELEAVNVMLGIIGESPVNSLDITGMVDVSIAKQILHEASRAIQSEGWNINTENEFELSPDIDGIINLPTNILRIDISDNLNTGNIDPVFRGSKLYDKYNHTFIFANAVKFDIVWFLKFTELPEYLRRYITISAARKFQKRFNSSDTIDSFTKEDEFFCKTDALNADGDVSDYNMMDNYSVYNILMR